MQIATAFYSKKSGGLIDLYWFAIDWGDDYYKMGGEETN